MNKVIYNLLNKVNKERILENNYLNNLLEFYTDSIDKESIHIKEEEFKKIFSIIYDVLGLRISFDDFDTLCKNYLTYLIADSYDGHIVDLNWFINNIWYLTVSNINTANYKDCILFIQNKLIKEFEIEEKPKTKVKRKIHTKALTI